MHDKTLSRRRFLHAGAASATLSLAGRSRAAEAAEAPIRFGVFSDAHYADAQTRGSRHYRDSEKKLAAFVRDMNKARPHFVIELGDFVDSGPDFDTEMGFLRRIEKVYAGFRGKRYHVIGNHDLARFDKSQFLHAVATKKPHYSFDYGGFHCIVLDANYRKDFTPYKANNFQWTEPYISPAEQRWLQKDLGTTSKKCLVFVHQRLDDEKDPHGVKNGPDVRRILESSGKVLAVFQGHDHSGGYATVGGIHYLTHRAMVEGPGLQNNSYALVTVSQDGKIRLDGFDRQPDRTVG